MDKNVIKDFSTLMAKLKRDTINFKNLNISKSLVIQLNDNTTIAYNLMNNHWSLRNSGVVNDNWDPTFDEVCDFIEQFEDVEVTLAIAQYEEDCKNAYNTVTAISLQANVLKVVELLKLEENYGILIGINDEITISINESNKQPIYLDVDTTEFQYLDEIALQQILVRYTYYQVITALNDCYMRLIRKN